MMNKTDITTFIGQQDAFNVALANLEGDVKNLVLKRSQDNAIFFPKNTLDFENHDAICNVVKLALHDITIYVYYTTLDGGSGCIQFSDLYEETRIKILRSITSDLLEKQESIRAEQNNNAAEAEYHKALNKYRQTLAALIEADLKANLDILPLRDRVPIRVLNFATNLDMYITLYFKDDCLMCEESASDGKHISRLVSNSVDFLQCVKTGLKCLINKARQEKAASENKK